MTIIHHFIHEEENFEVIMKHHPGLNIKQQWLVDIYRGDRETTFCFSSASHAMALFNAACDANQVLCIDYKGGDDID